MGVTIAPKTVISFVPMGVERVKHGQVCVTFIPQGVLRVQPREALLTFIPESNERTAAADTLRNVASSVKAALPSERTVTKTETANAATIRFVLDMSAPITVEAPAVRNVCMMRCSQAATHRELYAVQTATSTAVIQTAVIGEASVSCQRTLYKMAVFPAETARRIPYILRPLADNPLAAYTEAGVQSVSVTLSEKTLSDTFQMATTKPMNIEDAIKGKLLDYSYSFLVEETSQQNLVQTVKGMYGLDEMLYTTFHFPPVERKPIQWSDDPEELVIQLNAGGECSRYVERIVNVLGLKLAASYEDYQMEESYSDSGMTYRDLISTLFGWTSRLPQRQINVFIRGDTLHIIQRGMEKNVLDITDWPHTRPLVNRKIVRSLWNNQTNDDYHPQRSAHSNYSDSQVPFSGVIGVGKVYLRYVGGYLVYETNNGDETKYQYDGEYLVSKTSHHKDEDGETTVKTDYEYYKTGKDIYLMLETEVTTSDTTEEHTDTEYDKNGNPYDVLVTAKTHKVSTRNTYHAPIGGGWYLTSVYVDKKFQGSSLSQGPPGGKASQYMVDAMNQHLSDHTTMSPGDPIPLSGASLIDTSFPVRGYAFLRKLTLAIEWLNRKTQEDVSLEIVANVKNGVPDVTHVVDFTERVKLDGKEYFLVSNNVELTPRSLKQKLHLVRWY